MPNEEPTNHEILQAINSFADHMEEHFDKLESRMSGMEGKMSGMEGKMSGMEGKMSGMEGKMSSIESRLDYIEINMVTKDFLEEKLLDIKSDLVILVRKEDQKVNFLVNVLGKKKLLTDNDKKSILSLEPFPKIS